MGIFIDDEILEEIKDRINMVDLVGDYLVLEQSGANYVGLCPFHSEKTPSFTVSDSKNFFHCFGCGESGDAISFIMKRENMEFNQAVEFLANRCGIEVREKAVDPLFEKKKLSFEINRHAARYFLDNLYKNKRALDYLHARGIKERTMKKFGLGYALDSWDGLYNHLLGLGYKKEDLFDLGLISQRRDKSGFYDTFRNRVIFPIIDTKAGVVGFGGRVLDDSMPKYLNSQKTLLFDKGHFLYGVNLVAKESRRDNIILVEGYMDVISFYNNGINYSVASLGTAFTEGQAQILKRYGKNVYICYDSDLAGKKATDKAINILLKVGIKPKVIILGDYGDPDDFFKENTREDFLKRQQAGLHFIDFKILYNREKFDLNDIEGKVKFIKKMASELGLIESPVEREIYIEKLSKDLNISKTAIEKEMYSKGYRTSAPRYVPKTREKKKTVKIDLPPGADVAESELINLMLLDKVYFLKIDGLGVSQYFKNDVSNHIYKTIKKEYLSKDSIKKDEIIYCLKDREDIDLGRAILNREADFQYENIDRVIGDLIRTLKIYSIESKRKKIRDRIKYLELEKPDDCRDEFQLLFRQLMDLSGKLEAIKYDDRR